VESIERQSEINSKVVGAVGVSGDSPQVDEEIAIAGAKAISSTKYSR